MAHTVTVIECEDEALPRLTDFLVNQARTPDDTYLHENLVEFMQDLGWHEGENGKVYHDEHMPEGVLTWTHAIKACIEVASA